MSKKRLPVRLKTQYKSLLNEIRLLIGQAKSNVLRNINTELLFTYWNIGRLLVIKEHSERFDETSVRSMLANISDDLIRDFGDGFSRSQLTYMRLFYLRFPFFEASGNTGVTVSHQNIKGTKTAGGLTVSHQLSWSHYYELLKCSNESEIRFYQHSAIHEGWSVRELRRQIDTSLFERVALSKNSKEIIRINETGLSIGAKDSIAKDPYVLEFLDISRDYKITERELEQKIIDNLQKFILELGKGFSFIARQFRIKLNKKHYHVDLVFYHRILRCFILIDLKSKQVRHSDIGQMNMYLNYFEAKQNTRTDNPPIGIILTKNKDDITVEYAMKGISNKIFVSKYQFYLPDKKILKQKVKEIIEQNKKRKNSSGLI
jgi:predicted nuclease of restriction endonuclease-like (RecB) superfamily